MNYLSTPPNSKRGVVYRKGVGKQSFHWRCMDFAIAILFTQEIFHLECLRLPRFLLRRHCQKIVIKSGRFQKRWVGGMAIYGRVPMEGRDSNLLHTILYLFIYIYIYIYIMLKGEMKSQYVIGMLLWVSCLYIHQAYFYVFCLSKNKENKITHAT